MAATNAIAGTNTASMVSSPPMKLRRRSSYRPDQ